MTGKSTYLERGCYNGEPKNVFFAPQKRKPGKRRTPIKSPEKKNTSGAEGIIENNRARWGVF